MFTENNVNHIENPSPRVPPSCCCIVVAPVVFHVYPDVHVTVPCVFRAGLRANLVFFATSDERGACQGPALCNSRRQVVGTGACGARSCRVSGYKPSASARRTGDAGGKHTRNAVFAAVFSRGVRAVQVRGDRADWRSRKKMARIY